MNDLPVGWSHGTLGDLLLRIETGKSFRCEPRPASLSEWGIIKVSAMTWGSFRESENKAVPAGVDFNPAHEIRTGDILVSRANTEKYVGAPVLVERCRSRLLLSDKSLRLVPSNHIDRRWLYYLLASPGLRNEISRRATGTKDSMRNVSQKTLTGIHIQIPPLAEQHRIVAALEDHLTRLEAGVCELLAVENRTNRLWQAVLNRVISSGMNAHKGLSAVSVAQVANVQGGIQKRPMRKPVRNKYPFLRVANVPRGNLDLSEIHEVELFGDELDRYRLRMGDLLVVEGNGSPEQIGRAAMWKDEIADCVHQNHLIRVRPGPNLDPRYLELVWNSSVTAEQLRSVASSTSGLHTLSTRKIKSVQIPLPPRRLQEDLAAEADRMRSHILASRGAIGVTNRRATALRRSLLADASEGRLVPQDPADEPASVLLERMRAKWATQPKIPRERRVS